MGAEHTLARIQEDFAAGLDDPAARRALLPVLRGDPAIAHARLALYARQLAGIRERALGANYPLLKRALGEDAFFELSKAYARRFPSRSGDLNRFGESMTSFLEEHVEGDLPAWLPDLARLEWAVHCAHYACDAVPVSASLLASLSPGELDAWPVSLHPACSFHASPWNLAILWQPSPEVLAPPLDVTGAAVALVWRRVWKATVRRLAPGEATALTALKSGERLGAALEHACDVDPAIDAASLVERWLRDGLIVAR